MKLSTTLTLVDLGLIAASLTLARLVLPAESAFAAQVLMPTLMAAGAHQVIAAGVADRELSRLDRFLTHLDLDHPDTDRPLRPRAWLAPVAGSVRSVVATARRRIQDLDTRGRELELRLKLADAERQQMQAVLDSISDGVLVTDAFNELKLANPAAASALGLDKQSCREQPIDRVLRDPGLVTLIKEMRQAGRPAQRRHVEHELAQPGHRALYDVALSCVPNERQEVAGVVAVLHDVTRERCIAEVNSDFVSGVSHELRTPLSAIKAYIEMLADGEATDEQTRQQFYNVIQSEANRLSRLIDNILNISRIESGTVRVQRERLVLGDVIEGAVEVIRPQACARQIVLVGCPRCEDPVIADRDMLHHAFLNLLSNAVKYTPPGGRVWVETGPDASGLNLEVSVCDTGVGIAPESLPHVFEKFYRVPDHKKIAKGSGLGLSLVRHIIETVHRGRVTAESQPGRGSRFTISLPRPQA